MPNLLPVAGQAVLEGVLIRSTTAFAVAVRRASGEIVVRSRLWPVWLQLYMAAPWAHLPILRSAVLLGQMLYASGIAGWFAIVQTGLYKPLAAAAVDAVPNLPPEQPFSKISLIFSWILFGLVCATMFFALPLVWGHALSRFFLRFGQLNFARITFGAFCLQQLLTWGQAACQTGFLLLCLQWVSQLADIKRFLRYHGAVLKVLACVAANEPWDLPHARGHRIARMASGNYSLTFMFLLLTGIFTMAFCWQPLGFVGFVGGIKAMMLQIALLLPVMILAIDLNLWVLQTNKGFGPTWVGRQLAWPWYFCRRFLLNEPSDAMLEVAWVAQRACTSRGARLQTGLVSQRSVAAYQGLADACARPMRVRA